jgi:hypothetical protein
MPVSLNRWRSHDNPSMIHGPLTDGAPRHGTSMAPIADSRARPSAAPHLETRLSILSTDSTQSHSGSVPVRKLDSCRLKGLSDYSQRGTALLAFSTLK